MNQRRLRKIESEIERIKAQISKIGVIRPGSLTRQYKAPSEQRGAYYQISYTYRMKSRTEYVRSDSLKQLRQQIRDYTKLKRLVAKWVALGIEYSRLSMRGGSK